LKTKLISIGTPASITRGDGLILLEYNDNCSAIILAATLTNSFLYQTAAHSCYR